MVWNFPGFSLRLDKVIYSGQSVGYKATDGIWLLRFEVPRFSSDPRHSCLMADHNTNHTSFFISSPYVALTPTAQCFCPAYLQSAFESRVAVLPKLTEVTRGDVRFENTTSTMCNYKTVNWDDIIDNGQLVEVFACNIPRPEGEGITQHCCVCKICAA